MKSLTTLFLFSCIIYVSLAQVTDNFDDGNFTENPQWIGETDKFTVLNQQLKLDAPVVNGQSYLVTPNQIMDDTQWEFFVRLEFPTSSTNLARVYLVSNEVNLTGSLQGYYVEIGGTPDEVSLFRQNGNTATKIIDGLDGRVNQNIVNVRVKATRDSNGSWELFCDNTGGTNYVKEGSVTDNTFNSTSYFGFRCVYTSTRSDKFFFDDIYLGDIIEDTIAPFVTDYKVLTNNSISVTFSEVVESSTLNNLSNYFIAGIGNPSEITSTQNSATLTFSNTFQENENYNLEINNLKDLSDNFMNDTSLTITFFTISFRDVVINEIFADFSPVIGLPDDEFIELYNTLDVSVNLEGWKFSDRSSTGTIPSITIPAKGFIILCPTGAVAKFSPFGTAVGISPWPSLNNDNDDLFLRDKENKLIDEVYYTDAWYKDPSKKDGGWTLEQINPFTKCNGQSNWTASIFQTGGTPGAQNSVLNLVTEKIPPSILSAKASGAKSIEVLFNEPVNTSVLTSSNIFNVAGLTIESIIAGNALISVFINFNENLDSSKIYRLNVTNLPDCEGNILASGSIDFAVGSSALFGDVIISELLPDPIPEVGLPREEFIELYNRSDKNIILSGWTLQRGTTLISLDLYDLKPGEYVILCKEDAATSYRRFGNVLPVVGWQDLPNATDVIRILDVKNNLIDIVNYFEEWYNNIVKADGGWSLERKNLFSECESPDNWSASVNILGGTPGFQNSLNSATPEQIVPKVYSVSLQSGNEITLTFSEAIDDDILDVENFFVSPFLEVTNVTSLSATNNQIKVSLDNSIDSNTLYTLTISMLEDCEGNIAMNVPVIFGLGRTPGVNDIIISEIMSKPSPAVGLPNAEYFEIYNRSDKLIDLSTVEFADNSSFNSLPYYILAPGEYITVCDLRSRNQFPQGVNVLPVSRLLTLTISGKSISLRKRIGKEIIFNITYSDTWHTDTQKKNGGWSLEIIDVNQPCLEAINWTSSINPIGGTPSSENSVADELLDSDAPKVSTLEVIDSLTIKISFSKKIDPQSLQTATITVDNEIGIPSIRILDIPSNSSAIIQFSNALKVGTMYKLSISNLQDCTGNSSSLQELEYGLPDVFVAGDLIINEVLFNPSSGGVDFLEVYNMSNKIISTKDVILVRGDFFTEEIITLTNLASTNNLIMPNDYFVFTSDANNILNYYFVQSPEKMINVSSMPNWPDKEGIVILMNSAQEVSDELAYQESWHLPIISDKNGVSLERISFTETTQNQNNWHSAAQTVGFATPTYKNSAARNIEIGNNKLTLTPEVFTPNNDGQDDILVITYNLDKIGYTGTMSVYDLTGREVRRLINNETLPQTGFLTWDGLNQNQERVSVGIYIVSMEIFDMEGKIRRIKEKCVVGTNFR